MSPAFRPVLDRFWEKVDRSGGPDACWPWMGRRNPKGYGAFSVRHGLSQQAHRFALALDGRPIPEGMVSRHTCDNPPCVNPAHLLYGTVADNNRDKIERGRWASGATRHPLANCRNGHPYPESRGKRDPKSGKVACRLCHRDRERVRKARLRA